MTLRDLILCVAEREVTRQERGGLVAGHNGPYRDPETPVRASAHWLITFAWAYGQTADDRYLARVRSLAEYLRSPNARPHGFTFHCREKPGKDRSNGLIGQAWAIEGLSTAAKLLEDPGLADLAEEVYFLHPFDDGDGAWRIREVDGRVTKRDGTFNHQLWFAASAAGIRGPRDGRVSAQVRQFLDRLDRSLSLLDDGLVAHPVASRAPRSLKRAGRAALARMTGRRRPPPSPEAQRARSVGYHGFNGYGFAMLKQHTGDHPFWRSETLARIVETLRSGRWKSLLDENPYGYPYNPPGFEAPVALATLSGLDPEELVDECTWWVREQCRRTFNPETALFDRNTPDPVTLTARVYEVTRLPQALMDRVLVGHACHREPHPAEEGDVGLPSVTVIIPSYNAEATIGRLLDAIMVQAYPDDRVQVILVDNGSTDRTVEIARAYPVTILEERSVQSSYAARNTGLREAAGEVIVFTDADCAPEREWLRMGVTTLLDRGVDLVAGRVEFTFSDRPGVAERFDSVTSMQQGKSVSEGKAKTANLFVRAEVFETVGPFPNTVVSGGDVRWTARATGMGLRMSYAPNAVVRHPARALGALLEKQFRVGRGMASIQQAQGRSRPRLLLGAIRRALPPSPRRLRRQFGGRVADVLARRPFRLWGVSALCRLARAAGTIREASLSRR